MYSDNRGCSYTSTDSSRTSYWWAGYAGRWSCRNRNYFGITCKTISRLIIEGGETYDQKSYEKDCQDQGEKGCD